ncbi:MAG TPA: FHA domain-containing protein [Chromatiales bacterium]|nr:FHA domain-containing protein [Chromatiales bacterium]
MQLIDELKLQSKSVIRSHEQVTGVNEALLEYRRSEVIDSMVRIHKYLNSIIEQLHIIQPDILTTCRIRNLCTIGELRQKKYRQFFEHTFNELSLGITFMLESEKSCRVIDSDTDDVEKLSTQLHHFGLDVYPQEDNTLLVDGCFASSFVFRSNFNENKISLLIKNVENTEQYCHELQPGDITDALLNELGNFLLRKDQAFIATISRYRKMDSDAGPEETNAEEPTGILRQPRLTRTINQRQQLFLTYHEHIQELNSLEDGLVLGRSNRCGLVVPSDFASREHARIVFRKGKFVISDNSTNGTFIKIQGNREIYIHGEDYPLSGSGFISLGESTTIDNDHLIYFTSQD